VSDLLAIMLRALLRVVLVARVVTCCVARVAQQVRHSTSRHLPVLKCMGWIACSVVSWRGGIWASLEIFIHHIW